MTSVPLTPISSQILVPQLLSQHPRARTVLDRYGLKGCGGQSGPHETLQFFARMHGVEESQLLSEVQQAIQSDDLTADEVVSAHDAPADAQAAAAFEDTVYRPYFTGAILTALTAGATWGAYLLWKIGFAQDFTGISVHEVNAHGHAQIFGWVGLFVMGFALQAFPRLWHTRLQYPALAVVSLVAMLVGIVIRTIGMTVAGHTWSLSLSMLGGGLEIAAILAFSAQILITFARSTARVEPYVGYIVMGLMWFVAQALMSLWHTYNTMTAATHDELLWYIATYQAPLRDIQIHGLALLMILGVSIRMLPALMDVRNAGNKQLWTALGMISLAVVAETALFITYRWTHDMNYARALMLPWLMLLAGIAMVAMPWKIWSAPAAQFGGDRTIKFVRAAYAWLAISMLMLLMLPVYQIVSDIPFSHAYYGSIRHAVTVGFISLMIMGMAAKVVPTLCGIDPRGLTQLWGPFVLINLGCFLRVSLQTLTDWHPGFFWVVGVSGMLEVTALTWWGLHLINVMREGKKQQMLGRPADTSSPKGPGFVAANHIVGHVLDWYPQTLDVFIEHGFSMLANPLLRATLARTVTVAEAAARHEVDLDVLLKNLNAAMHQKHMEHDHSNCSGQCASCPSTHTPA